MSEDKNALSCIHYYVVWYCYVTCFQYRFKFYLFNEMYELWCIGRFNIVKYYIFFYFLKQIGNVPKYSTMSLLQVPLCIAK